MQSLFHDLERGVSNVAKILGGSESHTDGKPKPDNLLQEILLVPQRLLPRLFGSVPALNLDYILSRV